MFCQPILKAFALLLAVALAVPAVAQQTVEVEPKKGEKYIPSIWIDPDGCEHWVMDDGAEGYMSPRLTREGKPICRPGRLCGIMPTDEYFQTDKWAINAAGQQRLLQFFQKAKAPNGFMIGGHTDSRASDAYNMSLSQKRANAVALVAQQAGVKLFDVRGYGERYPRASNDTSKGRAQNRRVEIICLQ